ncbi:hypothetical protein F7734_22270 [Scytonema sp. UIC 10036]|uniref:hypothetical protein n=1 Tax=Scytonema sp. UIC 10036 TaxID=2304196 RepID=UPI0012DAB519|nr:hypothetical protein [Scytonema sp. UIC 10036]MUG94942.1 hypothetical protein [Scytonema sp. UIC 10036]
MTQNGSQNRLERLEQMLATHAEMLNQLAPLMTQVAQIATSTVETVAKHDDMLIRIERQTLENVAILGKLEQRIDRLTELMTVTTQAMQLVAENSQQIHRICDYLMEQKNNNDAKSDG